MNVYALTMTAETIYAQTIYALSSAPGRGGVAVVRVSGSRAFDVLKKFSNKKDFVPRQLLPVNLFFNDQKIDHGMAVYFAAPASFTGEDVVEYHVHGGRAVVESLLHALSQQPGLRPAEAGEFTKRAFVNGKMDLTEAEAIADLIDAETEAQQAQALSQLSGGLQRLYQGWTERLTGLLAHQEADIEFPDEDLPSGLAQSLSAPLHVLKDEMSQHLADYRRGSRLRDGIHIAILGAPNSGKSTLLNYLAARPAAIVSDEAGTTRDVIEVPYNLAGYPVIFLDTAGLRATENKIEAEGIKRAKWVAAEADIKIALFAGQIDVETEQLVDDKTIVLLTQVDHIKPPSFPQALGVSVHSGQGMEIFLETLQKKITAEFSLRSVPPTRERHRHHLEKTLEYLKRCGDAPLPELAAEDLRLALRELGALTGRVHIEDILDRVFKDFCIGK